MPSHTILPNPETLHLFYVAADANVITIVAGTYVYHSHVGLQLDRGLYAR